MISDKSIAEVSRFAKADKITGIEEELMSLSEKFSTGMSGLLFAIRFDQQTPANIKEMAFDLEQTMKTVIELQKELIRCTQD